MASSEIQQLKFLLDSSLDGIFATDLQLKIVEWNHQMFRFSGVLKKDCLGSPLPSFFPAFDDTNLLMKLKKVLKGHSEVIKGMPFNKILQHGINEFYEGYYSPVYNDEGEIVGLMGVVREIGLRRNPGRLHEIEQKRDPGNQPLSENTYQQISEKHNELIRIVNKSPAIAFSCFIDKERSFNFISDNVNQLGYNSEDLLQRKATFKNVIAPADYDAIEKGYRNYVIGDDPENFIKEYRVITPMGNQRWVQERSWIIKDDQGNAMAMEGVLVDVSVKKFAEEALMASKEHFRLIFEQAPIGMAIINKDGSFSKVNQAFLTLSGYDEINIYSINSKDLLHPQEIAMADQYDQNIFDPQGTGYKEERRLVQSNGNVLFTIEQGAPLKSGNEHVQKLIQVVDITSRKIAENNLIESENRIRQAQKFAQLGGWEYLLESKQLILSPEVYELFSLAPNQKYEPEYFFKFIDESTYPDALPDVTSFLEDDKVEEINREITIQAEDQQVRHVQVKAAKIFQQGQVKKVFGFILDITELKKTEMSLRTRNNELTNFVYKISHDLRSPLSSIAGLLALIKPADEENNQYLEMIKNRINRLDNFISDILTHSKNLYTAVTISEVDAKSVAENCISELGHLKNYEKVKISLQIDDQKFFSDDNRVKDIFKNVIANAIQYINPSKDEHLLYINCSISAEKMEAEFVDNGIGIDPKTLPRVFDIFFRGSDISTGSGIGLYIVKQSIEKLNGKIEITSTTRDGTRVYIMLPNMQKKIEPQE